MAKTREQTFKDIQSIGQEDLGDFSPDTLHNFAQIESSYGVAPGAHDITKKYSGTFQMGADEYAQFGDVSSTRMDTASAGKATLKYAEQNLRNTGSWKKWEMDKRMGDLGIDKGLQAYITHQQGRGGTIDLITSLREGGTLGAGTKKRILGNISAEKGTDFSKLGDKELVNKYLDQYKSKWSKASESTASIRKEYGEEVSSDFIGPLMPGQRRAEKKRGLEKPERPSLSDDDVFDSIAMDELDIMPDEKAPSVLDESEIGGMQELGLRREKMTIGENIGIQNTKGRELDDIMKVLSSPDDYKVAR